jgi:Xaa-Pro aminopeptidase
MDAIGVSRYLPVLVYLKGRPDQAAYFGFRLESYEKELGRFWPRTVDTSAGSSVAAIVKAIEHLKGLGAPIGKLGVEAAFLPWDCAKKLQDLRREEVGRGLTFEYCLITAGTSLNRAPSDQRLAQGDILSLDSGGNYKGYIGDLCRMGILGEPDAELKDLLGLIDEIQQRARRPIRPGVEGGAIFAAAHELVDGSPHRPYLEFTAHGMGLVSHEAPRLTAKGPVPYPGHDEKRPLEAGMAISIETTLAHPKRGFIKLEDTVVVTPDGWEGLGDAGRGWNRAGVG